jgi:CTP:molybdopterin cytidylyltransferase MocA
MVGGVEAVLLAAGYIGGEYAQVAGTTLKAFINLHGLTVLERIITTLRSLSAINRLIVIVPSEAFRYPALQDADAVIVATDSPLANLTQAAERLRQWHGGKLPSQVLLMATDLPFLTAEAVGEFLQGCPLDADLCVPVVRWEIFARRFPPDERFPKALGFWARLRDGWWRIGNVWRVNPKTLLERRTGAVAQLERLFLARKNPLRLLPMLGGLFVVRYLLCRLDLDEVKRHAERLLGCHIAIITDTAPELAFDLDTLDDYRYALAHWRQA